MSLNKDITELSQEEQRIRFLCSRIFRKIEQDPGLIWIDEIRDKLEKLKEESERVLVILKHLKSHYEFFIERFPQNAEIISLI